MTSENIKLTLVILGLIVEFLSICFFYRKLANAIEPRAKRFFWSVILSGISVSIYCVITILLAQYIGWI
jgi:hypothetical protein